MTNAWAQAILLAPILILPDRASATVPGHTPELDSLYLEARALLDQSGENEPPPSVPGLLEIILDRDPEYAPAYVELARFILKSSYRFSDGGRPIFSEAGMAKVQELLDHALELEPEFADTYVLYGYVAASLEREMLGLIALEHAESLGAESMWLPLNRARILEILGRYEEAKENYLGARAYATPGSAHELSILEALTRVADTAAEVEGYYKELLWKMPNSHVVRGNYAEFLLREGRFDEAIRTARFAERLGTYEYLHRTLALALYAKGTDLLLRKNDRINAAAVFLEADAMGVPHETILHDAVAWKATHQVVFALPAIGVDLDAPNEQGQTVLFALIRDGTPEEVQRLLDLGANPNTRDKTGWVPLLLAIDAKSPQLVKMLIDAGADPNATNFDDVRALDVAEQAGLLDIVGILGDAGATSAPAPWAAMVAKVRAGEPTGIDEAIIYLQTEEPDNADVLGALQEQLVLHPADVLAAAQLYAGVAKKMCGPAATQGEKSSVERRSAAVRSAMEDAEIEAHLRLRRCLLALEATQSGAPRNELPEHPTAAQREVLLRRALDLFAESTEPDMRRAEATEIARRLVISDPSDARAQLLMARLELRKWQASPKEVQERHRREQLESAAQYLEAALGSAPQYVEALRLYARVLEDESHVGLGRVVRIKAESLAESSRGD